MATLKYPVGSATQLPKRLLNFFAKYPPQTYSAKFGILDTTPAVVNSLVEQKKAAAAAAASRDPSMGSTATAPLRNPSTHPDANSPSAQMLKTHQEYPNPFLPSRNPVSSRWHPPVFSLREQGDIVKMATKYGVADLLPPGPKAKDYKEAKYEEKGLRIKGTGIGQKVKGHKWERTLKGRLEKRRQAMLAMPELIREWKQVCGIFRWQCLRNRAIMSTAFSSPYLSRQVLTYLTARPRQRVEEVCQMRNCGGWYRTFARGMLHEKGTPRPTMVRLSVCDWSCWAGISLRCFNADRFRELRRPCTKHRSFYWKELSG